MMWLKEDATIKAHEIWRTNDRSEELHAFGEALRGLCETEKLWASTPVESLAVKELLALLAATNGGEDDGIKIYVGLDSGFKTTGTARFCQFWGLYDYDISTGVINIYISGKTKDRAGSILHTFMSSRECSRAQCFMAEIALAEYSNCLVGDWMLSARLQRDIELLTPTEAILFMQRLAVSDVQEFPLLAARIRACCEYQLLEVPSIQQLRSLNATTYLEGKITAEKLVLSRLNWYTENGVYRPNTAAAVSLFNEIEIRVSQILMGRESEIIARLELVLQTILKQKEIDAITLTIFVISLLLGARTVMSQWSTWYLNIPCITDVDVANWYQKTYGLDNSTSEKLSTGIDISTTPIPRQALLREVLKEKNRRPWQKATADKQVQELAQGYEATIFMMDWYCKYSRAKMTYAYSPTWNLQCKAAVCTLQDMQKGVKLHNAFVHWRNAGDELWGGVLYFVIALLDKWVALLSGGSIVGLSDASSEKFRLAVGFGLAYYLIGAVSLDGVSQPLWQLAQKNLDQGITSLEFLRQAAINDASAKRVLYWKYFLRFFFMHVWGLAFSSALMWTFDNSRDGTIMYMAYVGAYMGLLWYQYNRIFTGPLAFKEPLVAVAVGLTNRYVLYQKNCDIDLIPLPIQE
ncbi:hypothetical protein M7I_7505 [Glarea lozoyensis 74030]|uniref:Uncharacterized protein n=1 Tax=Glarea lozoyensis (strain ATCC 74030 / MF5533) TaxID=1104152 RepID=H0EXG9_GLAL7|nr:hypothetical protein M7I_7505 [Glarea lozoyensis 74030]